MTPSDTQCSNIVSAADKEVTAEIAAVNLADKISTIPKLPFIVSKRLQSTNIYIPAKSFRRHIEDTLAPTERK